VARLHRYSGALLGLFLAVHLANQLLLLRGPAAHLAAMEALRVVYRWPPVEALLLACVLVQIVTGFLRLRSRSGAPVPAVAKPARLAGIYLLYFLAAHTLAVLGARALLKLDSNLYFAAAGLHVWPYSLYFVPHYVLAVTAVFVHLGSALAPRLGMRSLAARKAAIAVAGAAGCAIGAVIVAAMAGDQVHIPPEYTAIFPSLAP
jgi:succinate dehydrogenase/fumarate reductase cytochrome b subunit